MIDCAKRIVDEEGVRYVVSLTHYVPNLLMSLQGIVPWMGDNCTRSVASVRIPLPNIAADYTQNLCGGLVTINMNRM